ncbi:MAG: hypothetical protein IKR17_03990, partial [Bacteroidales bacterium]|nr:hypothetical protein [Bacteroidales bacterium]
MKKRIVRFILALLIVAIVTSQYINAIWPNTIPYIDGFLSFWLILLLGESWFPLCYDKPTKLRHVALVILANICLVIIPTFALSTYFEKKGKTLRIGYIQYKDRSGNTKSGRAIPDKIHVIINDSLVASFAVSSKTFNKTKVGDSIIVRVSNRGHISEKDLFPTHEIIERYKVPQHYVNGKLQEKPSYEQYSAAVRDSVLRHSHKQVGYVYDKTDDEYYRHLVKVGIDAEHTTTHEFYETDRNYTKVYKRLHVGDAVILQVADSLPEINRVLCWQPDGNDIANYATYEAITDYSNCSKEFETEMLHQSHKRIGFVYDKYQDEHIGAYIEVGIDKKLVRTFLFKTFEKNFEKIYQTVNIGDTVVLRVSDSIPQINRVLIWHPTPD